MTTGVTAIRRSQATAFEDAEVVAHYHLRAPYPQALFDRIFAASPGFDHALDLGCGTGKITEPLAARFSRVTAVDPSAAMLAEAQSRVSGGVTWLLGKAEEVDLPDGADLAVFGESIHWMRGDRLFPRLAKVLKPTHRIAVVTGGDAAHAPAWTEQWEAFLSKWVPRLSGVPIDLTKRSEFWTGHRDHLTDITTEEIAGGTVRQRLTDFIQAQFSRSTFSKARLGDLQAAFTGELRDMLAPFADAEGYLSYETRTDLTLARLGGQP